MDFKSFIIVKQLAVSKGVTPLTFEISPDKKTITIHDTGNASGGDIAKGSKVGSDAKQTQVKKLPSDMSFTGANSSLRKSITSVKDNGSSV